MTMKFNDSYAMFAFQAEKDTAADAPLYYLRLLDGSEIGPDREIQVKRTAESGRANDGVAVIGQMGSGGTLNFVCQPTALPAVLLGSLGDVQTAGSTDPYTHTAQPEQDGALPWITMWVKIADVRFKIVNLKVNSLSLVVSSDDRLMAGTWELMGAGAVTYQSADPTVPAEAEDINDLFAWNMAKGTWNVDGATVGYVKKLETFVRNNLTGIPGEDFFFYDIQEGTQDNEYSATTTIMDASFYNQQVWGSATPADDAEPAASIAEGSFAVKFTLDAAPERSLAINVTESQYRNPLPKLKIDPEGRPQDLVLTARCVGTDPKITYVVKNGTASYAIGT